MQDTGGNSAVKTFNSENGKERGILCDKNENGSVRTLIECRNITESANLITYRLLKMLGKILITN